MSVEPYDTQDGRRWRVRWRDPITGSNRSKGGFARRREAQEYDRKIAGLRLRNQLGLVAGGEQTLAGFIPDWLTHHARPRLAPATIESYAALWDKHLDPFLGGYPLRELSPAVIDQWQRDLLEAGVGPSSVAKSMSLLQGMLSHAVLRGRLEANPCREVRKAAAPVVRITRPCMPAQVEAIRALLRPRDAALVSALAYLGLRPQEALLLRTEDIGQRSVAVRSPKTAGRGRPERQLTRIPPQALTDLREWMMAGQVRDGLLFSRRDERPMGPSDYRNWRARVYMPAAGQVLKDKRPYLLRASFGSWLIHEGRTVVEVAEEMGNSPGIVLKHYARALAERDPDSTWTLAGEIANVRAGKRKLGT